RRRRPRSVLSRQAGNLEPRCLHGLAERRTACRQMERLQDQLQAPATLSRPGTAAGFASVKSNRGSMIWIPGGSFLMGSNEFYREERPAHQETEQGLWIDPYPVTNAEFGKFVGATGYVTTCERPPDPAMYPDADPFLLVPGSSVFRKPRGPVDLRDNRAWWG